MKIDEINYDIKCDMSGCTNKAKYSVDLKKSIFSASTHICEKCMKDIYDYMALRLTPKSIKNPYQKPKKIENN